MMTSMNLLEALTDNIVVDKDKCTFCGECVEVCVLDNLRLKLAPCRQACPLEMNCQAYVQMILRGAEDKGRGVLREKTPFAGTLGYICSRPCEEKCERKAATGEAVAIRALKRYLMNDEDKAVASLPSVAPATGKKVAIVGGGPAGLSAAFDLKVKGHAVTVYDAESEPGGLLRWAIPEFRLPKVVLGTEINLLERLGVGFRLRTQIGPDLSLDRLRDQFEAVVVAVGCGRHRELGLAGEGLPNVRHGLPFLRAVRAGQVARLDGRVVVIGGGNVAVDVAQTALRLGAASVSMVSLERDDELPAYPEEVENARAEGVKFRCGWGPTGFREVDGRALAVELQRCLSVFDESGRFCPSFDVCETEALNGDHFVVAIGQGREEGLLESAGLVRDGQLTVDALTLQTAKPNVFLAGDVAFGPSSAVEAMASGRRAAESVHRFLTGEHLRFGRRGTASVDTEYVVDTAKASPEGRVAVPARRYRGVGDFGVVEGALDGEEARREAARCYSCGEPYGKHRTCWFCLPCEVACPEQALRVEIPYLLR